MKAAYNQSYLENLLLIKEAKRWLKAGFISKESFDRISLEHETKVYHPNIWIRLLLFLAALLVLSGITGLFSLFLLSADSSKEFIASACVVYGIVSFVVVEVFFISTNHYKSGINEAIIYHACGFTIGGVMGLNDFDSIPLLIWTCFLVFSFAAIRYLDLITTLAAIGSFAYGIFYHSYEMGGFVLLIIPFLFILIFGALYFVARKLRENPALFLWDNVLILAEAIFLLLVYAGGNYLVVRELSINLLNLQLEPQQDIPYAMVFYVLTILLPITYLFVGIKRKDIILIRVSLFMVAFSVFTFKYYYSFGHPEITLTIAGALLLLVTLALLHYLKTIRNGYTRENLLSEKWAGTNVQAFVISQTMGGNANSNASNMPGGGASGGGGSSDSF